MVIEQRLPYPDIYRFDTPYQKTLEVVTREFRFKRNYKRVVKTVAKQAPRDSNGKEIKGDKHE